MQSPSQQFQQYLAEVRGMSPHRPPLAWEERLSAARVLATTHSLDATLVDECEMNALLYWMHTRLVHGISALTDLTDPAKADRRQDLKVYADEIYEIRKRYAALGGK